MEIRKAQRTDIERLRAIARAAYRSYVPRIGQPPAPMVADFDRLVDRGVAWVVSAPDICGYIVLYPDGDALHIENIAVDPMHHGKGFGRALLDFAERQAKSHDLGRVELYTNVHMRENLSLYPSFGYREIGRRNEDGFDRVYFSKHLQTDA